MSKCKLCFGHYSNQHYEICEKNCNKNEQLKCKEEQDKKEKERLNNLDIKPSLVLTKFGCEKCG